MNKRIRKALLLILSLWVLSCSRTAAPSGPNGGGSGPSSSNVACSVTNKCADTSEVCDLLLPSRQGGTGGTCKKRCSSTQSCSNDDVCNLISGACETNCAQAGGNFCLDNLPANSAASAVCVSNSYCALAEANPGQGNCEQIAGLKSSGGFCKIKCSSNADCVGSFQRCDATTGTCEVKCNPAQATNSCKSPSYALTGSSAPQLACSEITATCVPSCSVSATLGPAAACTGFDAVRTNCYAAGYSTGSPGTCEKPCTTLSSCGSGFSCAEGVCQTQCSSDTNPGTVNPKRTRCDYMTGAYGVPCSNNTTCTNISSQLACSPVSATCVAGCNPAASMTCPSQDSIRNGCLNIAIGVNLQGYASCEISCTGYATGHNKPSAGTCSINGVQPYYCAYNPNSSGSSYVHSYCAIQCALDSVCSALSHSQTCSAASICSL